MMEKLKKRWGIDSNFQVVIIIIVFSITGSLSAFVVTPLLKYVGITTDVLHPAIYWPLKIILILPVYNVLLLIIGTLFGQRVFFWNFVKKMLQRIGLGSLVK